MKTSKTGLLLINLGTPQAPTSQAVRPYLREFLMDPLVVDIPWILRWPLVHFIIAPFRSPKSAKAYRAIWTAEGSPLKVNTRQLADVVSARMPSGYVVDWAMRYGEPKIIDALKRLRTKEVDRIRVLPLYPQFALSSTQSSVEEVKRALSKIGWNAPVQVLRDFHNEADYVEPLAQVMDEHRKAFRSDHILMSYHGLPVRHVRNTALSDPNCGRSPSCCDEVRADNRWCYRAQSYATSRALAHHLRLKPEDYTVAFQSRLGRTEWIRPYTDEVLAQLVVQGVKRLLVVCPSFVADCLETLEEIGIRAREDFIRHGGEDLALVPCLNSRPDWAKGLASLAIRDGERWSSLDPEASKG